MPRAFTKRRTLRWVALVWSPIVFAIAPSPARSLEPAPVTPDALAPLPLPDPTVLTLEPEVDGELELTPTTGPDPFDSQPPVEALPNAGSAGMVFPVAGRCSWSDTWGASRGGGRRRHIGQDLMAAKMTPMVAAFPGVVYPRRRGGHYLLTLKGDNGWSCEYMHVNNDTPGTDDGRGSGQFAFAPGVVPGARVAAGQLLGWVGDSGNAEGTDPHLHFELRAPGGSVVNAAPYLRNALRIETPLTPFGDLPVMARNTSAPSRSTPKPPSRPVQLASRGSTRKPLIQLQGVITSAPTKDRFTLRVVSVRYLDRDVTTQLQPARDKVVFFGSQTRIATHLGQAAGRDRLAAGAIVEVTGPNDGTGTPLRAVSVTLQTP